MADPERMLNVPKPAKRRSGIRTETAPAPAVAEPTGFDTKAPRARRNVTGFATAPPAPATPPTPKSTAARPRKQHPTRRNREVPDRASKLRVHASVSVEVAMALKESAVASQMTHTEILAESVITYGADLVDEHDGDTDARYTSLGFERKRSKQRRGRMSAAFYISQTARTSLDQMAEDAGFSGRSALIDALLRRYLDLPD